MSSINPQNIISELQKKSKDCHSIKDFLDLSISFNFENITINPFQIRTEIHTLLEIIKKEKPKNVLEIGTANGGTLFLLSKICPTDTTLVSVDLPEGKFGGEYFPDWKIPFYKSFVSNQQKIHILRGDSHQEPTLKKTQEFFQDVKIDFLFIDGDHTYEGVKKDFEMYSKLVSDDGLIVFHDICPGPKELAGEVSKFWNEIKSKYPTLEIIDNDNTGGYGLGLLFPNLISKKSKKYVRILETLIFVQNSLNIEKNRNSNDLILPIKKELEEEIQKRVQLQKEFDERTEWALILDKESKEKDNAMTHFQNLLSTKESQSKEIQDILSTKDAQLQDVQRELYSKQTELDDLKHSILFKIPFKITRGLDKMFPPSTKRGEIIRLSRMSLLIIQNEGFGTLLQSFNEKVKRQRFLKKNLNISINSDNKTQLSKKTKINNTPCLIQGEKDIARDDSLRNFIHTNYSNILNLPRFPKVSIIIPTFNQVNFLRNNLKSIEEKTTYQNYEIIIITNNLDENSEMRKFLNTTKHTVCIFKDEYSFSAVNNFAAEKAIGEYLLFLNDDVEIVSPNWLESMLKLALQEKVGAVGAKLLFSDGKLQEAGGIVWKDGIIWNYGRNENPQDPRFNFVRNVDYCSGSCLMIKKELFKKFDKFDTQYKPAYCEDTDMCLSLQKGGFKILYQPLATIIHHEGKTSGTDLKSGIKSYQIQNQKKFRKKWQQFLNSRLNDSMDNAFFERNRKNGNNILYIDHYVPEYDKDAGSLLVYNMLSILSYLDHKVTFWPDNLIKTEPYTTNLQQKGIEIIYDGNNFESFIKKHGNDFQICILTRAHIAPKYIDLIKKYAPKCKVVYDTVDLHFIREFRESVLKNNTKMKIQAQRTKETEFEIFQKSDVVIVKSTEEVNFLLKEDPSLTISIIPTFEIPPNEFPSFDSRENLLFIGGFQHPPNVDSLENLVKTLFPKIRKQLPDVKLYVIGSNPTQHVIDVCSNVKNIEFLGYVKNIEPYLKKCRLLLAPIRFGAGVKGKITQSMTYGLVVVTTPIGAEGISDKIDDVLSIADNDDQFVEKAVSLYGNKELWTKLSLNSRKHSEENFSPEYIKSTLEKIITTLTRIKLI